MLNDDTGSVVLCCLGSIGAGSGGCSIISGMMIPHSATGEIIIIILLLVQYRIIYFLFVTQ